MHSNGNIDRTLGTSAFSRVDVHDVHYVHYVHLAYVTTWSATYGHNTVVIPNHVLMRFSKRMSGLLPPA